MSLPSHCGIYSRTLHQRLQPPMPRYPPISASNVPTSSDTSLSCPNIQGFAHVTTLSAHGADQHSSGATTQPSYTHTQCPPAYRPSARLRLPSDDTASRKRNPAQSPKPANRAHSKQTRNVARGCSLGERYRRRQFVDEALYTRHKTQCPHCIVRCLARASKTDDPSLLAIRRSRSRAAD